MSKEEQNATEMVDDCSDEKLKYQMDKVITVSQEPVSSRQLLTVYLQLLRESAAQTVANKSTDFRGEHMERSKWVAAVQTF